MNTLVTVGCTVKTESQTSPQTGKVGLYGRFKHPHRTVSCGALLKNENTSKFNQKERKKNSFEIASNPEVEKDQLTDDEMLRRQQYSHRKQSICSYPPSFLHTGEDAVPEIKVSCQQPLLTPNPKRNTVINLMSPLSPVKVFSSTSLLPVLTSSPQTNRYSFGSYVQLKDKDSLKYIDESSNVVTSDRPFSISPSYQSEFSDCSFFPPTASSFKCPSPQVQSQSPDNGTMTLSSCNCTEGKEESP